MAAEILGLIGPLLSSIFTNAFNQNINDRQYKQQQEAMRLQSMYNDIAAGKADERTRALYTDLMSPEAMRKQYEKAGLSVGMMYGQGGTGGSLPQGAQASGTGIPNKAVLGMQNVFDTNMAKVTTEIAKSKAETELLKSQQDNVNANTENLKADLPLKEQMLTNLKQEVSESESRIQVNNEAVNKYIQEQLNIAEDTKNKEKERELIIAKTEWQNVQTAMANIDLQYKEDFNKWTINQLKAQCNQLNAAAKKMNLETEILDKTKENYYKMYKAKMEVALKESENWDGEKERRWKLMTSNADYLKANGYLATEKGKDQQFTNSYYSSLNRTFGDGVGSFMKVLNEDLIGGIGAGVVLPLK